jgi:hypothetical protein
MPEERFALPSLNGGFEWYGIRPIVRAITEVLKQLKSKTIFIYISFLILKKDGK